MTTPTLPPQGVDLQRARVYYIGSAHGYWFAGRGEPGVRDFLSAYPFSTMSDAVETWFALKAEGDGRWHFCESKTEGRDF
jgi:hypothetical protein